MQAEQQIRYYNADQIFILQLEGEVRFTLACALIKIFSLIEESAKEEILDLTNVKLIDSTILGLFMQHVATKYNSNRHKPTILCNDDIKKFFTRIGADNFFTFKKEDKRLAQLAADFHSIEASEVKNDLISYVLSAHEDLHAHLPNHDFERVIKSIKKEK